MFLTSTRVTFTPHGSVASSKIALISELIVSLDVRVSSNSKSPIILRKVVAVKVSIALIGRTTP